MCYRGGEQFFSTGAFLSPGTQKVTQSRQLPSKRKEEEEEDDSPLEGRSVHKEPAGCKGGYRRVSGFRIWLHG